MRRVSTALLSNTRRFCTDNHKIKVYTKTGDSGYSSLFNGTRLPKTSAIFNALGDTDEVNCYIGLVSLLYLAL